MKINRVFPKWILQELQNLEKFFLQKELFEPAQMGPIRWNEKCGPHPEVTWLASRRCSVPNSDP